MPRISALLLVLAAVFLAEKCSHASYIDPAIFIPTTSSSTGREYFNSDDDIEINVPDYGEDPTDLQMLQDVGKRACIRRGGNCDHRPGDCCHSSSCRCNLWGSNCRCQRMGLFQKWG